MDVWIVFTPVLKILLYLVALAVVGTKLFDLHFSKYQTIDNIEYCYFLSQKCCLYGFIISAGLMFSIAGNLGGEFLSILDPIFFELALVKESLKNKKQFVGQPFLKMPLGIPKNC